VALALIWAYLHHFMRRHAPPAGWTATSASPRSRPHVGHASRWRSSLLLTAALGAKLFGLF
jgi:hypothetical protein